MWLARFGPEPPALVSALADAVAHAVSGRQDDARLASTAGALGVLRAQQGHTVRALIEDVSALRGQTYERLSEERLKLVPLRRSAPAEEMACVVAWMLSDTAAYLTGHTWMCKPCQDALRAVNVHTFHIEQPIP